MVAIGSPVLVFMFLSTAFVYGISDYLVWSVSRVGYYVNPESIIPRLEVFRRAYMDFDVDIRLLVGHGVGGSISQQGATITYTTYDNMYLTILYEFGILGLVAFGVLIYRVLCWYDAVRRAKAGTPAARFADGLFVYLCTVLFDSYVSQNLTTRSVLVLFLFSILAMQSLSVGCARASRDGRRSRAAAPARLTPEGSGAA
jgi:hypothetical protein